MPYSDTLKHQLAAALAEKGPAYQARTQHLKAGQAVYTNRLILQDSPYLLQHAHNPVDWYAWGEEAFAIAKSENKPVFLSIGYATCHWCHVMEEESFENIDVAKILNEFFICIKVDREQHPDVDQSYMTAVTMISGRGGWPMSSFLCPDGKPFYAGTYYKPLAFINLLHNIQQAWREQEEEILKQAQQLAAAVQQANATQASLTVLQDSAIEEAVDSILLNYDARLGGFSQAPKFPQEPALLLLLQVNSRAHYADLNNALQHTLRAMAQGGMYDQVGGGFHRYSVDERWLVPHFEKMLYNQAYLGRVYTQAYLQTGNALYARIVKQTLDYVLAEMTDAQGNFYSASDADSEGHEGSYFVWHEEEINQLLGVEDGAFINRLFGLDAGANFEGRNVLFLPEPLDSVAKAGGMSLTQFCERLDPLLLRMRSHRKQRVAPLTDDKILLAWNAMMITALLEAGQALKNTAYLDAARVAGQALWRSQFTAPEQLWRVRLQGKSSIAAKQEDFAHFAEALLALYDSSGEALYLQQARCLCDIMLDKFIDTQSGAMFMGQDDLLFTRPKDAYDGALPSGNAVAVKVLSRLSRRCGEARYAQHANSILQSFANKITQQPIAYAYMLAQLDEIRHGETGCVQYANDGSIRIKATTGEGVIYVDFDIKAGVFINAETLRVELECHYKSVPVQAHYPQHNTKDVAFQASPLNVYQGQIQIKLDLADMGAEQLKPCVVKLGFQACAQQSCYSRQNFRFML